MVTSAACPGDRQTTPRSRAGRREREALARFGGRGGAGERYGRRAAPGDRRVGREPATCQFRRASLSEPSALAVGRRLLPRPPAVFLQQAVAGALARPEDARRLGAVAADPGEHREDVPTLHLAKRQHLTGPAIAARLRG